jgi:hypothetical protein
VAEIIDGDVENTLRTEKDILTAAYFERITCTTFAKCSKWGMLEMFMIFQKNFWNFTKMALKYYNIITWWDYFWRFKTLILEPACNTADYLNFANCALGNGCLSSTSDTILSPVTYACLVTKCPTEFQTIVFVNGEKCVSCLIRNLPKNHFKRYYVVVIGAQQLFMWCFFYFASKSL